MTSVKRGNLQRLSSLVIGLLRTDGWQKSDQYLGQTAMNGWVPRYEFLLTKTDNSRLGVLSKNRTFDDTSRNRRL